MTGKNRRRKTGYWRKEFFVVIGHLGYLIKLIFYRLLLR